VPDAVDTVVCAPDDGCMYHSKHADAVDTVVCAPDDGCMYHSKHAEQFPEINKLCNVASCWLYIRIYLRYTDP